jgi:hypothetical protein
MLSLIYGLIEGSTAGWTALPAGCLVAGAALLAGFGMRQRRAAQPLILPSLLANRGFTAGLLLGLASRTATSPPEEAGSASGALSAVQQLAAAIGSAVVTTVYFSQRAEHGAGHAMLVSVAVVAAIAFLCLGLAGLLPRSAPADEH